MAKTIHRYTVGQSGSSQAVETVRVAKDGSEEQVKTTPKEKKGVILAGAEYWLRRLPFTKPVYRKWPQWQRIVLGYLLWLVALPLLPLFAMIAMWTMDPQGFRKNPAFYMLAAITVLWFWLGFSYVNGQMLVDSTDGRVTNAAKSYVQGKTTSQPTNGRTFKSCTEAFNAGVFNIAKTDSSYQAILDGNGNGVACEK